MSHVHWWLCALSFGLGLVLTLTLMMTPVKHQVPVAKSPDGRPTSEPATTAIPITERRTTQIPVTERRTTRIPVAKESPTAKLPVWGPAPYGPGSADAASDGGGPAGYLVKALAGSKLYFTPDDPAYDRTTAQVWFADEKAAQQAGFAPWSDSPDNPRRR
ncbi:hypothetical protein [Mycobacterium sp. 1465703.0]|uniref:channel accessory protein ArfC, sunset domain variant n=1 Tax=Mycobacterium sp. 1465703.0 TaxID=1834078 RepID=UPI000800C743|nr:hypothetical protein [Mycobacterium sp. 1465703.0]OBJ06258.1 hypothetical protein A5625_18420 [Mycobacterium sp. 1465703.0]